MNFLETLSREEMRTVTGGYGTCEDCIANAYDACYNGGHVPPNLQNECMDNQVEQCSIVLGC
jgi:hypothetical protein